eukprot:scaffold7994_cov104-Skeletonema_menzelii.AAC.3
MKGAAKDLLNKDAALGLVDKDNSDECFEYIKKNLSEEHASLCWGCHLGGTTTGEMKRAAIQHRKGLIILGVIEEDDHEECLDMVEKDLSKQHANLLRPILMKEVAYETFRELISLGNVNKDDLQKARKSVATLLSEAHANLITGYFGTLTTWNDRITQLQAFIDENEHANVPQNTNTPAGFGIWVKYIRQYKKKGKLSAEKIHQLDNMGFEWGVTRGPKLTWTWDDRITQLQAFIDENEHANVPQNTNTPAGFGIWVKNIRHNMKKGKLSAEKIHQLNGMGFEWGVTRGPILTWDDRITQLQAFINENEHANVPQNTNTPAGFGIWVKNIRQNKKKGKLSAEKIHQLNNMGFEWRT